MMLVHTLSSTHSTHRAVLPATLTHQDLLHCVLIQRCLHGGKHILNIHACQDIFLENQFKCSEMNYLHGLMLLGAYEWDGVNLLC